MTAPPSAGVDTDLGADPAAPTLFERAVAGLQDRGHLVSHDPATETFEVLSGTADDRPVTGVVLSSQPTVVLYAVWDEAVGADHRTDIAAFTVLINPAFSVAALEFDHGTGILAARAAVGLGELDPGTALLGTLLSAALDAVGTARSICAASVDAVVSGAQDPESAAAALTHRLLQGVAAL